MRIVVIGGGLAAATAVAELRERGFEGEIDLVTAEARRPYERPPLSKGYLLGREGLDAVYAHEAGWEAAHGVTLHLGDPAHRIGGGVVALDSGAELSYDRILLATGAAARRLDVPGADAPNVRRLRTLDDSDALRAELSDGGRRVVVVGSGWIGLETAAAAREFGNDVTILSPDRVPLAKALGDEMGDVFLRLHREHGVEFLPGRRVTAIETGPDGAATGVRAGDETIPADLAIVGIGAVPDTALAETAGAAVDGGVFVDEHMRTSVTGVFAAGDCANPVHPVLGERLRTEHWATAIATAKVAAANMLGGDAVHDDIPYFFTDQYDLGMEFSGYAPLMPGARVIVRGDLDAREFVALWVAAGRVVAGMNVNVWDVNEEVQRLIRDRVEVSDARLADPAVPLDAIA
ncbi:NAD(P)/FAD-dependent oxidoreductase [Microbacterium halophytorum]|uniref:NAD(P)/FAD-dependent oxidoreductase n=1 Tax=Microbacterium halophytorum TaxID=2067568 RepID=UPI000CFB266C|nr:FAD-dependent oxidoreductase [Microbacterium halophytorum]